MTSSPTIPNRGTVLCSIEDHWALITLNRPEVHNAIDDQAMAELEEVLDFIEGNPDLKAIIITGAGHKTFCAGGDIRYFATLNTREACVAMSQRMQAILTRLYKGERPVIAAVNGQALGGGCEILTATHIRYCVPTARFAFRQAPNGIITGWGGGERFLSQVKLSMPKRPKRSG